MKNNDAVGKNSSQLFRNVVFLNLVNQSRLTSLGFEGPSHKCVNDCGLLCLLQRKHTDTTLQHQKLAHDQSRQPLESVHIFSTAEFFPPEISRNEDDKQSNSAN